MSFRKLASAVSLLLLIFLSALTLWGQGGTGEITGIVKDPTGAVVPDAQVTLTNDATGVARNTKSSAAGVYTFPALPVVGTYTLSVAQPGFKEFKASGIVVSVGAVNTRDIELQVGQQQETVTVEAGAQDVQATESQVSGLIDQRVWQNMPLETRNQNSFIDLVPGAVPDLPGAGNTRGAAVNGTRGGSGNYMVEGMDNNDQGQGGRGQISSYDEGGAVTSISPDSIQEYRVITNSYSAEYGKAGGFITDTVLKSGTNKFHGSLFEYNRIQALAANNFFSNRSIDPVTGKKVQDRLVRNQFGGSIGGPIIKDKTFFFGSAEFHRAREASVTHAIGTTQQFLDWVNTGGLESWAESDPNGICMQYTGAACPGAFANSAKLGGIFNKLQSVGPFPVAQGQPCTAGDPNCTGGGYYTSGLTFPVPLYGDLYLPNPYHLNEYRVTGKIDHKLTARDQLSGYYLMQDAQSGDTYGGGAGDIGPAYIESGRNTNLGVTWDHTINSSAINTFKASFLRHIQNYPSPNPAYNTMPQIIPTDSLTVGFGLYAGLPQYFTDNQFQFQDHISFVRGKHSFKAGAEYRRIRNGSRFFNDAAGTFYPWGVEDMVTDLFFTEEAANAIGDTNPGSVYFASAAVDPTTGQVPQFYRGFRANEMAAYFQDDWRVTNRLTLNLGLRYEYFGVPHNFQPNIDSNFYFGSPVAGFLNNNVCSATVTNNCHSTNPFFPVTSLAAAVQGGNFQVRNHEIWNKDTNNFGPRLGFAYDVLGNQKLIMRAGAGVMYDRIYNNIFENIRFNPPYYSDNQIGSLVTGTPFGAMSTPGIYGYPFTSTAAFNNPAYAPKPNPRHMDQNLVNPYYEQLHFGLQYEIANGYVFEPEYVATFGRKLLGYYDINTFDGRTVPGQPTTRINPNIGADNFRTNAFSSNYNALQLGLRKTYSNGLGFQANYTWSKALDTVSDVFNARTIDVTDVQNIRYDYGPADFNLQHRFVANVSYNLPFFRQNRWLGGWMVNSIVSIQSGVPFSIYNGSSSKTSYDLNRDGRTGDRLVTVGGMAPMATVTGKSAADGYFNTADWTKYTCPADVNGGLWCDAPIGRNSMTGPGYWNTDFNVSKRFKVTEGSGLTFQANFFNLFNHANFHLPSGNVASTSFGKSTAAYDPRITQLALRFDF